MLHPLTQISNLLVTVNSSVNFIIYCIFGEKFKCVLLKIICTMIGKAPVATNFDSSVTQVLNFPHIRP